MTEGLDFFERVRQQQASRRELALVELRRVALAIADGGNPDDGVLVFLKDAGITIDQLQEAVEAIKRNRELLATSDRLEGSANSLAAEAKAPCEDVARWHGVVKAIRIEMAGLREAEASGDLDAYVRLQALAKDLAGAQTKKKDALRQFQLVAEKIKVMRAESDTASDAIADILGEAFPIPEVDRVPLPQPVISEDAPPVPTPPGMQLLESIRQLVDLGVSHIQICELYGFSQRWMILAELDSPGFITSQSSWQNPQLRLYELKQAAINAREQAAEASATRRAEKMEAAKPVPCRETPQELWRIGVSFEQAAHMLRMRPLEVRDLFDGFAADARAEAGKAEEAEALATEERLLSRLQGV